MEFNAKARAQFLSRNISHQTAFLRLQEIQNDESKDQLGEALNNIQDLGTHSNDLISQNNSIVAAYITQQSLDTVCDPISESPGQQKNALYLYLDMIGLANHYELICSQNISLEMLLLMEESDVDQLMPTIGSRLRLKMALRFKNYFSPTPGPVTPGPAVASPDSVAFSRYSIQSPTFRNSQSLHGFGDLMKLNAGANLEDLVHVRFHEPNGKITNISVTKNREETSGVIELLFKLSSLDRSLDYKFHDEFDFYETDSELLYAIQKLHIAEFWVVVAEDNDQVDIQAIAPLKTSKNSALRPIAPKPFPALLGVSSERPTSVEVTTKMAEYFPNVDEQNLKRGMRNSMKITSRISRPNNIAANAANAVNGHLTRQLSTQSNTNQLNRRLSNQLNRDLLNPNASPSENPETLNKNTLSSFDVVNDLYDLYDDISDNEFFELLEAETRSPSDWYRGKILGMGSYGSVYLGFNQFTGEIFAVKQILCSINDKRRNQLLESIKTEITTLRELDHPNIVTYLGFNQDGDYFNLFLEYVSGGSLASQIKKKGPVDDETLRHYLKQCLLGLQYLHSKNIIHRDIKGANILVDADGVIKISDFGISKFENLTQKRTSLKGTAYWMAPEVAQGEHIATTKIDIWSLGCVVIELLTGSHPFPSLEALQAIYRVGNGVKPDIPNVAEDIQDFVAKCLEVDPAKRASAADLLSHPFITHEPQHRQLLTKPV